MGKTKITTESNAEAPAEIKVSTAAPKDGQAKVPKKKITSGIVYIDATFNNTKVLFADKKGNTLFWSSAGALGFKGAKKGTSFAASRVASAMADIAQKLRIKDINIFIKGIGGGRESALRSLAGHGLEVISIRDVTPIPHNGCRPRKVRRV